MSREDRCIYDKEICKREEPLRRVVRKVSTRKRDVSVRRRDVRSCEKKSFNCEKKSYLCTLYEKERYISE